MMEITLKSGRHESREDGMCLMEAVAFLAGEPHSDHPACTDPVLGAFGRALNDEMTDDECVLLAPLAKKLIGTAGDHTLSLRRAMMLCDGVVRQIVPIALDAAGLSANAQQLRDLQPIIDQQSARSAGWSARSAASAASSAESAASAASSAESAGWSARSAGWSARSAVHKAVITQIVWLFSAAMEIK
jgi:hypothetical protein